MDMLDQFNDLNRQLDKLDAQLVTICRTNETCRRLSKLPGVGPVIATTLVAAVDDGRHFRSGRIGLVPRQYTTGGRRPNSVADEAVSGEPVSVSKFPASREFAGNFSEVEPDQAKGVWLMR
jgi:transposase